MCQNKAKSAIFKIAISCKALGEKFFFCQFPTHMRLDFEKSPPFCPFQFVRVLHPLQLDVDIFLLKPQIWNHKSETNYFLWDSWFEISGFLDKNCQTADCWLVLNSSKLSAKTSVNKISGYKIKIWFFQNNQTKIKQ